MTLIRFHRKWLSKTSTSDFKLPIFDLCWAYAGGFEPINSKLYPVLTVHHMGCNPSSIYFIRPYGKLLFVQPYHSIIIQSEPTIVRLPTHICVTRPQWFNRKLHEDTKSKGLDAKWAYVSETWLQCYRCTSQISEQSYHPTVFLRWPLKNYNRNYF